VRSVRLRYTREDGNEAARRKRTHMKRLIVTLAVAVAALVLGATAWAAAVPYMSASSWSPGQGNGSAFSSSWFMNVMYKGAPFDTTITFIDNVSYAWVNTRRSTDTYMQIHWLSSQVKKAHCRSNVASRISAGCTVYS
jgi:hypothetical protein